MTKDRGLSEDPVPDSLEADIGLRLRKLRKSRNLTISELASRAGVSAGAISQIERNLSNPTVRMLEQLRIVLNVPLTAFLENEEHDPPGAEHYVRRLQERPGFHVGKRGIAKELLSPKGDHQLQFMIIDIPAQIRSDEVLTGYGEKAGLLLEGELTLEIEGNSTVLHPGDSFQFKSSLRHNVFNHTHSGAKVLWIMHIQPENHL
ncbi:MULTISPECIES: helix-turn-helix domain-containing protein [Tatumella]|uniref:HTH-type transcriptional regulator sinR n=2 Tax=Tatumella ptyseos TaxID=82987 RepID=A0A2X5NPD0_9GAMM|nr:MULTISPECIES: XRE family transcriptional regulator [Tatumella]KFD19525.1 putative transcriptional regulator [Tatumella ptyseos ATCC 33301]SQK75398.1 HTH-type transcriptional regulator sinR [Tatumella ptyseos]